MFDFFRGATCFVDGILLLLQPGIKRFVAIPLLINIILFIAMFGVMQHYVHGLNDWLSQVLPTWLQWFSIFIWLLFLISFFLIVAVLFVTFANLIGAPFLSLLAEKVELQLSPSSDRAKTSAGSFLADIPRIFGRQLAILLYYLPRAMGCFILFFIPVIQIIAPFLWFYFNAWFMTLTYYDYPSDNHQQAFSVMLISLKQRTMLSLGFGMAVLICSMIPLLNLIVIPAAVAGATKLWLLKRERP